MKLKPSSIILLVMALVLATSSALVARSLMRQPAPSPRTVTANETVQAKPKQTLMLLTTAHAIQPGEFIGSGAVRWLEKELAEVPAGAITGKNQGEQADIEKRLFGATVRKTLQADTPITHDMLLRPGDPGFIAAVLAPGKRAISIPTSAVTSNSGLVSAGDWVDVILSVERDEAANLVAGKGSAFASLAAQTILRQVRVLALNSNTESIAPVYSNSLERTDTSRSKAQNTRRISFETITLEVSPEEAERLAVAREAGSLQVVLRGVKEKEEPMASADVVTRLRDTTAIFNSQVKAPTQVQTFHGSKAGMVNF